MGDTGGFICVMGNKRNFVTKLNSDVDEMLISGDIIKVYLDKEELEYLKRR